MPVQLFPNWIVKLVRNPNLRTKHWLTRPVEVFHVSPKMTKMEIKEYLIKLYNLPVSHVHTAIYEGKKRLDLTTGRRYKDPDFKKAYVYLHDSLGAQKPRYHEVEFQKTPEARAAWPSMPHRYVEPLKKFAPGETRPPLPFGRDRSAARQKPLTNKGPHDNPFPTDMLE